LQARTALVIGATGGIGAALVAALQADPRYEQVLGLSRCSSPPVDLLDEGSIKAAADYVRDSGLMPSLILISTGLLHARDAGPEKSLAQLDPDWMMENFRINSIGPALIAKHFLPLSPRKEHIVFAALSARVGSISDNHLGGWHSYRASKAALNMVLRNIAIEWQRKNPQSIIVGLHPGTVDTALSAPFKGDQAAKRFTPAQSAARLLGVLDTLEAGQSGLTIAYDGSIIAP
jgi:NAD(P)-dependent dehydrogenase (short-subunit alcohol dehydrogenase family)